MILDKVDNIDLYAGLGEKFKKAINFIKTTDLVSLADGKYPLEDGIYYSIQHYTTNPIDQGGYEAHRKYIDLQMILQGSEKMGYASLDDLTPTMEYSEEWDVQGFQGEGTMLNVPQSFFCIFFPTDGHKPGVNDTPCDIMKLVVKIPVE